MTTTNKKVILLADDDLGVCRELELLLNESGYQVKVAHNGADALQLFSSQPFDLVITDIYMPRVDGLDLIVEMKKKRTDLKAIVISGGNRADGTAGTDGDSYAHTIKKYGGVEVLQKPFRGNVLLEKVGALLGA